MFNSIKIKLALLFLVVFSVFFLAIEFFLYHELESVVIRLADDHLRSEVESLANILAIEEKHGQIDKELQELSASASQVYADELSGHYFQIVAADGKILARSPSLLLADASLPAEVGGLEPVFKNAIGPAGEPMRMMTAAYVFDAGLLTFVAGDSLDETYRTISSFRRIVLYIFPGVFMLSSLGVLLLAGWALRPVRVFSAQVEEMTEEKLGERVDEKALPVELKPLATSFNAMLARLDASFSKQKQFLSDASHELRTPTTIIKSFCEVTLGKDRSAEDYRQAIEKVGDTVNRMCDIINRILVISRLDTKTIHFKPVRVDLRDVLGDVARLIEPTAARKGVELKLSGPSVTIRGDREGLTEVFTNIVENAVKYNRTGGRVDISVWQDGGESVVKVSDTGVGIPAGEKERIFDRFYRVDESRSQTVGSGLGLSIVRSIVEGHGGRIEVDSTPGEGSTFTVRLPQNFDFGENAGQNSPLA